MTFKVYFDESQKGVCVIKKHPLHFAAIAGFRLLAAILFAFFISVFIAAFLNIYSWIGLAIVFSALFALFCYFLLRELRDFYPSVTVDQQTQTVKRHDEIIANASEILNVMVAYVVHGSGRNRRIFYEIRAKKLSEDGSEFITIDRLKDYDQAMYAGDAIASRLGKQLHYIK